MKRYWDYADLSARAKAYGGPALFEKKIYSDGFSDGQSHGTVLGSLFGLGTDALVWIGNLL